MRAMIFALAAACLSSCGPTGEPQPDSDAAIQLGEPEAVPHALPPPSAETPRFVGLWAAAQDMCTDPAWRFRADGVSTQGEVSCTFNEISIIPAGYDVQATCNAEGNTSQHQMQITFAESAGAMMIANGPWSPAPGLVYCGALPAE